MAVQNGKQRTPAPSHRRCPRLRGQGMLVPQPPSVPRNSNASQPARWSWFSGGEENSTRGTTASGRTTGPGRIEFDAMIPTYEKLNIDTVAMVNTSYQQNKRGGCAGMRTKRVRYDMIQQVSNIDISKPGIFGPRPRGFTQFKSKIKACPYILDPPCNLR